MSAILLGFPVRETALPIQLPETIRSTFDAVPSEECIEEIEDWERRNRRNAAALLRRNPTIR